MFKLVKKYPFIKNFSVIAENLTDLGWFVDCDISLKINGKDREEVVVVGSKWEKYHSDATKICDIETEYRDKKDAVSIAIVSSLFTARILISELTEHDPLMKVLQGYDELENIFQGDKFVNVLNETLSKRRKWAHIFAEVFNPHNVVWRIK